MATGTAPVQASSSSNVRDRGLSPVTSGSSSLVYSNLESHPDEGGTYIPVEFAGTMYPIFPRPIPPVDFAGLPDPTTAPTVTKSTTGDGILLPGTYRYSYAAWKGNPIQATAPSPVVEITLTTENTVSVTPLPIDGADGYLIYREDL